MFAFWLHEAVVVGRWWCKEKIRLRLKRSPNKGTLVVEGEWGERARVPYILSYRCLRNYDAPHADLQVYRCLLFTS